jgi:hypothetical protein
MESGFRHAEVLRSICAVRRTAQMLVLLKAVNFLRITGILPVPALRYGHGQNARDT